MTPYQILKKESEKVGWPKHYKQDLTKHDKSILSIKNNKGKKFIWMLREYGTHMYTLEDNKYCDEFIIMLKKEGKALLIGKKRHELVRFNEWCNDKLLADSILWMSSVLYYNQNVNVYIFNGEKLTKIKNGKVLV